MLNVRTDFPFLERKLQGKPLVYLDSAATTQKPRCTIERIVELYSSGIANVHRAVNTLADEVTQAFEAARDTVARFIGGHAHEIIFVLNSTYGINLVAGSFQGKGTPRILTNTQEHHSNILPWTSTGNAEFIPWSNEGALDMNALDRALASKPDLLALSCASNFLGAIHPVHEIIRRAHDAGVAVLLDASQSIPHASHNVQDLDCDYLVFSGHKLYGPGGIGVLYVRDDLLESMRPLFLGGSMVKEVHAKSWVPNDVPYRFEAGTPPIEGAIGLAAAIKYLEALGFDNIAEHESAVVQYAKRQLSDVRAVKTFGPKPGDPCAPLVSFQVKGLESSAVAKTLGNRANVIVRSGFLCAQPAHDQLGVGPSVRASFAIYNTCEEVDIMVDVLKTIVKFL